MKTIIARLGHCLYCNISEMGAVLFAFVVGYNVLYTRGMIYILRQCKINSVYPHQVENNC